MAHNADFVDDEQEVRRRARLVEAMGATKRRESSCDCISWASGQRRCGGTACRDAYGAEGRCASQRGAPSPAATQSRVAVNRATFEIARAALAGLVIAAGVVGMIAMLAIKIH